MEHYSTGVTAVVDRCVYISLNPTHGTTLFRKVLFAAVLVETHSCMPPSRCMLPSLRSAPYPALCPCKPRRPVGDKQALSCGARSRHYSRLLPASSLQPRSIVERAGSGPMGRIHVYRYIIHAVVTPPARRVYHGTRYAPGTEKECCVGRAWSHREAAGGKWSSGVAAVFGVYYNKNVLKNPFGHHYYYRASYNKDIV